LVDDWEIEDLRQMNYLLPSKGHLLEKLDLKYAKITQNEIGIIGRKLKCPRLKQINLSHKNINDEGFSLLSNVEWPLLEQLSLNNTKLTSKGMKEIVYWPLCSDLNLSFNKLDDEGVGALSLQNLSLLEKLDLSNTKMTYMGIDSIVKEAKWPQLKSLNLSDNNIGDQGLAMLSTKDWPLLENLNLSNTKLTLKGIKVMTHESKWSHLRCLNLSYNEINDEGLEILSHKDWSLLEKLNLSNSKITSKGVDVLVNKMNLANLKRLDISYNKIFDEGLEILASGKWPLLEDMIFYNTKITLEGLKMILKKSEWPNLKQLGDTFFESIF